MPLQSSYFQTCHYNFSYIQILQFYTSFTCLGTLSARIRVHIFRMDETIRVYLVVIDIHIVDCHIYLGEPCPSSHVLSCHIYRPSPQCNTSTTLYAISSLLHGITSLGSNPRPQTLVFRCSPAPSSSRRRRPSLARHQQAPATVPSRPPCEMSISAAGGGGALHPLHGRSRICRSSRCRDRSI